MSLVDRVTFINKKKTELTLLVRVLEDVYGDKEKLSKSLMKGALLGDDISELRKHPAKVMEVFLPIIRSYGGESSHFTNAVDALLNYGVDEFYRELRKVMF
jgi:iron-sulfur cluster repair protein YtfE (RIC family)